VREPASTSLAARVWLPIKLNRANFFSPLVDFQDFSSIFLSFSLFGKSEDDKVKIIRRISADLMKN
jgi:hypothetical protein